MSYSNPSLDSHGRSILNEQPYRLYYKPGGSNVCVFSEDELCTKLVKLKSSGDVIRYDELDVARVVPVDENGIDIEMDGNDSPEDLLRVELKADVAQIRQYQEKITGVIDRAQNRMAEHYGSAFDSRLSDNLNTMLTSGADAEQIFDECSPPPGTIISPKSQRVSPVVNAVLKSDLNTTNTPVA